MLDNLSQLALLYDFYGQLLTPKQQEVFDLYYQQDLSLGEIAEEHRVSRQAIYDLVKRSEKILQDYENKLRLVSKFLKNKSKLELLREKLLVLNCSKNNQQWQEVELLINQLINE